MKWTEASKRVRLAWSALRNGEQKSALPAQLQSMIDDAEAAVRVAKALDPNMTQALYSHSMGFGVICNCNFIDFNLLDEHGLTCIVDEAPDGRANIRIKKLKR